MYSLHNVTALSSSLSLSVVARKYLGDLRLRYGNITYGKNGDGDYAYVLSRLSIGETTRTEPNGNSNGNGNCE